MIDSMAERIGRSFSRIGAIAGNTYREAIRMRLFLLLALTGVASLAVGLFFQEFNLGSNELSFIADFGFGGMTLLGSIVAVVVTVQLLFGEIEHRSIMPLLAKPVSRGEFVLGKVLGAWLTICSFIAALTIALVTALWIRETQILAQDSEAFGGGRAVSYAGVLIFACLQCMRLAILASISAFFAAYATSSIFAIFMGFFVWIIGQLHPVISDQLAHSTGSISDLLLRLVTWLTPDMRLFDLGADVVGGPGIAGAVAAKLLLYAALYAAFYTALAAFALGKREL